nr:hypothetical protein 8 [bacterium]
MSALNKFTPEEIQALVNGESISKSVKDTEVTAEVKTETNKGFTPATSRSPRTSVPISKVSAVSTPRVKDTEGKVVNGAEKLAGPSSNAFTRLDEDRLKAEADRAAFAAAQEQLKQQASPEQLLNQLNATRRVVEKLQKEVAQLKKQVKE